MDPFSDFDHLFNMKECNFSKNVLNLHSFFENNLADYPKIVY